MIKWENIKYDFNKATKDFQQLEVNSTAIVPIKYKEEFEFLRQLFIVARDDLFNEYNLDTIKKLDYKFDLLYGLKIYEILNEDIGFTNRVATNDEVWRYLSICVIPDVVHSRWSKNEDHFYKVSRRIWLKTIWWYIHLSWCGSSEGTYNLLKENSTDTILQLVERPGIGYYLDLYREIMLQYQNYEDTSRNLFRRVLQLNTAKLLTTSPELVEGGIKNYVKALFESVNE